MTSLMSVPASGAFDMIGPYLATSAKCPACGAQNRFVFLESYSSPVKAVQLCEHIRARVIDDDGDNHFEFEVAHAQRPAEPGSSAAATSSTRRHA